MSLFRVTLELLSPLGTALASPTIFGQLCWIKCEVDGEEALKGWLSNSDNIWRLSDGFPHNFLPKPLTEPKARNLSKNEIKFAKEKKKLIYVSRKAWLEHRKSWSEDKIDSNQMLKCPRLEKRLAHNIIDRHSGGSLEEGGLFFTDEDWRFCGKEDWQHKIDIYVEAQDKDNDEIERLFSILGQNGFGRDASTGRGRWKLISIDKDDELKNFSGNRLMSLSRGVLTPKTMLDVLWKVIPHFGRAGPQISLTGVSPFKKPILLTKPGASFRPSDKEAIFGKWLSDIHPERPEIGLNGLHVAIPFNETEGG